MLVVGKEASTLSKLHGIANCVKNGTRKIVSSNRYQRLARCSVAHTYFRSSLRILFTAFLETKIQLWKLMWTISGCCIGSSGRPLHPPLLMYFTKNSKQSLTKTYSLSFSYKFVKTLLQQIFFMPIAMSSAFYSIVKYILAMIISKANSKLWSLIYHKVF